MSGLIYEPKGDAKDYADLAFNLYKGCDHGCLYCFAPGQLRKQKETFHSDPDLKDNVIEKLEKELKNINKKNKFEKTPVLMSFISDVYQPIEEVNQVTRDSIMLLNEHGFPVRILTKAGELAQRDFDVLSQFPENEFGVSLTLSNEDDQQVWEPKAASPTQRIENLKEAKDKGIITWLSLEPIIYPDQAYDVIDQTHEFVDHYGIGKLNRHSHQKTIGWKEVITKINDKLDSLGKKKVNHKSSRKMLEE
jgi:DNA repair photolyase